MIKVKFCVLSIGLALLSASPGLADGIPFPDFGKDKLSLHGYFTQAFGMSDGHQVFGIPEEGTDDYRNAALQLRYELTDRSTAVVQVSHESMGESNRDGNALELDWAFFEQRFSNGTALRIGRVQIPFGIWNELRDVGTILPFHRLPVGFYGEDHFTSETVDGLVASHVFENASPWRWSLDGYGGRWKMSEAAFSDNEARVDALGVHLWVDTPVDGLRLGLGARTMRISDLASVAAGERQNWNEWSASLDSRFDRLTVQAEYRETHFERGNQSAGYLHLGYELARGWSLHAQVEMTDLELPMGRRQGSLHSIDLFDDVALSIKGPVWRDIVLKLEYHVSKGFLVDDPTPDYFFRFAANEPFEANYGIIGVSYAF